MTISIENQIFSNLFNNEIYSRKVLPHLNRGYFSDVDQQVAYTLFANHVDKYNVLPSKEALIIDLGNKNIPQDTFEKTKNLIDLSFSEYKEGTDNTWLIESTEQFCKDKALYNAVRESISIIDGSSTSKKEKTALPDLLTEALSVSFDTHIGHDYLEDATERYEFYHHVESRIKFDLEYLNLITGGGLPDKTLNVIIGGTGVGKTRTMCHMAGANLLDGKNVLYVTFEMAEERIAERIDANLMGVAVDDLIMLEREVWDAKVEKLKTGTTGKIIIQEYPTVGASVLHIKSLLTELRLKKKFIPDIIYIDYLNIMASSRLRFGGSVGSYAYIKSIAEELRGLAQSENVPIVTGTQTNRDGFSSGDPDMDDTAESFGLPMTVDFMIALITSDELESLNQIMVKQLKNRYRSVKQNAKGVIGVDDARFRLYDLDSQAMNKTISAQKKSVPTTAEGYPLPQSFQRGGNKPDLSSIHDKLSDVT